MKSVFVVTKTLDGKIIKTAHTAVQSFLEHPDGPDLSKQYWSELSKKNGGYPIQYKNFLVEKIDLFSTSDSRTLESKSRII